MEPGAQVGRYRVEREVARGGMGAVYRAQGPDGRPVALKLLLAGRDATPLQRRRITTEVTTLLRLRHPHLVPLLDAGELEGVPYLVLEWIEGETLAARLERQGPLDPRDAAALVQRLAEALAHCHAQGVLHRDLKPPNVLLRAEDGAPLLTDFGLAKDLVSEGSLGHTASGQWLGTPGFWPPEQARGELRAVDERSDVYGLGGLLYAALTGAAPQAGETLQEALSALERPAEPPSRRRPGVPAWLDAVCLRALSRDPEARQEGAAELARELAAGPGAANARGAGGGALAAAGLLLLAGVGSTAALLVRAGRAPDPSHTAHTGSARTPPMDVAARDRALSLGQARFFAGDLTGSLAALDQALAIDPRSLPAHSLRAGVLQAQGRLQEAVVALERGQELAPDQPAIAIQRGVLRALLGQLEEALDDLNRAVALAPDHEDALGNRAAVLLRLGRREEGLADLSRALRHHPGDPTLLTNRGAALVDLGRAEEALRDLDQACAWRPRTPARWAIAPAPGPGWTGTRRRCGTSSARWRSRPGPPGSTWPTGTR